MGTYDPDNPTAPPDKTLAPKVWAMMGNQIEWQALDVLTAMLGIDDVDRLVYELLAIRNHGNALRKAERNAKS